MPTKTKPKPPRVRPHRRPQIRESLIRSIFTQRFGLVAGSEAFALASKAVDFELRFLMSMWDNHHLRSRAPHLRAELAEIEKPAAALHRRLAHSNFSDAPETPSLTIDAEFWLAQNLDLLQLTDDLSQLLTNISNGKRNADFLGKGDAPTLKRERKELREAFRRNLRVVFENHCALAAGRARHEAQRKFVAWAINQVTKAGSKTRG